MVRRVLVGLALVVGCSDDPAPARDAGPDAPPDTSDVCGAAGVFFTGEYVDWDSTTTEFLGIFKATFTVRGDAARTDETSPNGRWEMCIANDPVTLVDVATLGGYVGGTIVVVKDVLGAAGT